MAILDAPGGNDKASFVAQPHERPAKPYPWRCTNPGCPSPNQVGRIEDGCPACGAGADAVQRQPLPPTNFNCSACRGSGTVERKCGACQGTGMADPPQLGEPPPSCEKCGGSGGVAFTCGRCDGSGIDPAPMTVSAAAAATPLTAAPVAPPAAQTPAMPTPQAGIFKAGALPSIDEEGSVTSPDRVVRYRLIRYEGPRDWAERTLDRSLEGTQQYPIGATITAIEIAEPSSKSVQQAVAAAQHRRRWPAQDEKY